MPRQDLDAITSDPEFASFSSEQQAKILRDAQARQAKAKKPLVTADAIDPAPKRARSIVEKPTPENDPLAAILPKPRPVPAGARRKPTASARIEALNEEKMSRRIGTSGRIPTLETVGESAIEGAREAGNMTVDALRLGAEGVASPTLKALEEDDERKRPAVERAAPVSRAARIIPKGQRPTKSVSEQIVEGVDAFKGPFESTAQDLKAEPSRLAPWSPGAGEGAGAYAGAMAYSVVDPVGDALLAAPVAGAAIAGKAIAGKLAQRAAKAARKGAAPTPAPVRLEAPTQTTGQREATGDALARLGKMRPDVMPKDADGAEAIMAARRNLMDESAALLDGARGESPRPPVQPPVFARRPAAKMSTPVDKTPDTIDGYPVNPTPAPTQAGGSALVPSASTAPAQRRAPQSRTPEVDTPAVIPAGPKSRPLDYVTEPAAISGKVWYHGTGTEGLTPKTLDPTQTKIEGLFGQGVYLTDNPDIAGGYAVRRGKNKKPVIYQAGVKVDKVLDLEQPAAQDFLGVLRERASKLAGQGDEDLVAQLDAVAARPGATNEDLYLAFSEGVSEFSQGNMIPTSELYDDFFYVSDDLRRLGYDAYTHTGGKRTGRDPHQVLILLDPNDVGGLGRSGNVTRFDPWDPRSGEPQAQPGGGRLERLVSSEEGSFRPASLARAIKNMFGGGKAPEAPDGRIRALEARRARLVESRRVFAQNGAVDKADEYTALIDEIDAQMRPQAAAPQPPAQAPTVTRRAPVEQPGPGRYSATLDPDEIRINAREYQFKDSDAQGRTDRMAGVEKWDAEALESHPIMVHERADGTFYVADGHQRVNLAKRLKAAGQNIPPLQAIVYREADGWSVPRVRALASKRNVQEGTGTAIDVARLIRDGGMTDADMGQMPRQGEAGKAFLYGQDLAKMDEDAFQFVTSGMVKPAHAAEAVRISDDPATRVAILREMAAEPPTTATEARLLAQDVIESGLSSSNQMELFGLKQYTKSSRKTLYRIVRGLERAFANDKQMGAYLTSRAKEIQAIEGNTLNPEANEMLKSQAGTLQFMLGRLSETAGEFRETLKRLASEVDSGRLSPDAALGAARDALTAIGSRELGGNPGHAGSLENPSAATGAPTPAAGLGDGAPQPAAAVDPDAFDIEGARRLLTENPFAETTPPEWLTQAPPPQAGPGLFGDVAQFDAAPLPPAQAENLPGWNESLTGEVPAAAMEVPPAADALPESGPSQAARIQAAIVRTAGDLQRAQQGGNQAAVERLTARIGIMQRDYARALDVEAPVAAAPRAEVPPPPSRRQQQGRLNNLRMREKKAWDAGNQQEAGRLAAEAQLVEDAMNPRVEKEMAADPNGIVASEFQNFRKLGGSEGESRIFAELTRKSVAENPRAKHVTFEDVANEAAGYDPRLLDSLAKDGLKPGHTLHPAVRQAMRDRVKAISGEIDSIQTQVRDLELTQQFERVQELEAMEAQLRRDAQTYIDVLIPARSQDGRNLAFHRMTASDSFAPEYWLAKAARIATGSPTGRLPEAIVNTMSDTLRQGDNAKTRLAEIVADLKARGVDTSAVENLRVRVAPALDDQGGVMSGFMNQLKRLFGQEKGEWDQAAFDRWMMNAVKPKGRRGAIAIPAGARRPGSTGAQYVPPMQTGDPEIDALLAEAFEMAQDVNGARISIAKQLSDLDRTHWIEAVALIRKAGLLSGLGTIQRNIIGTWAAIGLEEVVRFPAAGLDAVMAAMKMTEEVGQRSTVRPRWNEIRASLGEVRGRGVQEFGEVMTHGMTMEDMARIDNNSEMNTGIKALDTYVNTIMRFQSAQDRLGKAYAYSRSIQDQARVLAEGDDAYRQALIAKPTEDMARNAVADAEFATFTNDTMLGDRLMKISRADKKEGGLGQVWKFIADQVMPFKKTPASVATRVIDYTPLGPVIRIGGMMLDRQGEKLVLPTLKNGMVVSERVRDSRVFAKLNRQEQRLVAGALARGGVGSALMAMGALMAHNAMAVGNYDPRRREEDEMSGRQPGSIRMPELLGGGWVPIGAMSPVGNLIALGASLYESGGGGFGIAAGALGTVLDQPMTQGAQQIVKLANPSEDGLWRDLTGVVASNAGSFVPTLASEFARAYDADSDGYATDRKIDTTSMGSAITDSVMKRIPGLRNNLPPKVDALGNDVRVPGGVSAFGAFAGRPAAEKESPVAQAIIGLGLELRPPSKGMREYGGKGTADDVTVKLTPAMTEQFHRMRGTAINAAVAAALESEAFAAAVQAQNMDEMRRIGQKAVADGQSQAATAFRKLSEDDLKAGRAPAIIEKIRKERMMARPMAGEQPWWAQPGATVPPGARRGPVATPAP